MYNTCEAEGKLTMTCSRSIVKSGSSIGINYLTGEFIAWAGYTLAPEASGTSIGAAIGATYAWGADGGTASNKFGDSAEYFVFDVVGNFMDVAIETAKEVVVGLAMLLLGSLAQLITYPILRFVLRKREDYLVDKLDTYAPKRIQGYARKTYGK